MKILHTVESYYPSIGGMQEVVKQLSERLFKLGHQVTVATRKNPERDSDIINGVQIKEFDISGNFTIGMTGEIEDYKKFLLNSDFDIITNFAAQQWATDIALPILDNIKAKKLNVPTGFSGLYKEEYALYFENMKHWMRSYDANIFLSNNYRDINFARENGIKNLLVIPNGAAKDEFLAIQKMDIRKKLNIAKNDFLILHVGSYTGIKGHVEALKIYLKSNITNGVLLFVGYNNQNFLSYMNNNKQYKVWKIFNFVSKKRVIVTQLTREETVAAYKAADLFLFPSNVECSPIVLFECMAARIPFLTTDVGNSKEIIEWSDAGMILPTRIDKRGFSYAEIRASSKMLDYVYGHKELREQLASRGFNVWESNYTWEAISKKYETLYLNLLNQ